MNLTVAGWGKTENGIFSIEYLNVLASLAYIGNFTLLLRNFFITATFSNFKLKVNLPVVSKQRCDRVYRRKNVFLGSDQMCAGGRQLSDTCGDSGGSVNEVN